MPPRKYTLGKRANAVAQTRTAIVEAACDLMIAQGFDVSTRAIARRAEVSDGTVRNHFPSRAELIEATVREAMLERLEVPDASLVDDLPTLRTRVERLVSTFHRLYSDTADFYVAYSQVRDRFPVLGDLEAEFWDTTQALIADTLGEHAANPDALRFLAAMIHPQTSAAFAAVGHSATTAGAQVVDVLCAWLEPG